MTLLPLHTGRLYFLCVLLSWYIFVESLARLGSTSTLFRQQLRVINQDALQALKVGDETATRILDDPRMADVHLPRRIVELRLSVGMTRTTLKQYLNSYPDVCIGFFVDKVKTAKSVVMRVLQISEQQYDDSVKRIPSQTNNKSSVLFRGSFPFIVASLRDYAGLSTSDLSFIFVNYPTFFTLDYRTVNSHLSVLRDTFGYSKEQMRLLLLGNCRTALCGREKAVALMSFFQTELGISAAEFREMTVAHPRLLCVSIARTLQPKVDHLLDAKRWDISRPRLTDLIRRAPSVLTTPAATTRQLWYFLHNELGLTKEESQDIVRKYPNLLRVNAQMLDTKLRSLTLAQLHLLAEERGLYLLHVDEPPSTAKRAFRKISQQLYADVASALLQRAPVALTCSLERIEGRMQAMGAAAGLGAASLCETSTLSLQSESKNGCVGAKGGVLSLSVLLNNRFGLLKALTKEWEHSTLSGDTFPVPPHIITVSEKKFKALLHKRGLVVAS